MDSLTYRIFFASTEDFVKMLEYSGEQERKRVEKCKEDRDRVLEAVEKYIKEVKNNG